MQAQLLLDPAIRNWVLIPITLVMILTGLLRHYISQLLNTRPPPLSLAQVKEQRAITRSELLRASAANLPPTTFRKRKAWLAHHLDQGTFVIPKDENADPPNPLDPSNMDAMMGMMKKQMVMFVPQTLLMGWINFFFSGFVLTRLPFPLTVRFKSMLQRGLDTADLDSAWVSSISWYFLTLFGLNSVFKILLGDAAEELAAQQAPNMSMNMPAMMPGAANVDMTKLHKSEKSNLDLAEAEWVGRDVENRLLALYPTTTGT